MRPAARPEQNGKGVVFTRAVEYQYHEDAARWKNNYKSGEIS